MENIEKKTYITPELTIHGDVEVITLATGSKQQLDKTFPVGTPFGALTFS